MQDCVGLEYKKRSEEGLKKSVPRTPVAKGGNATVEQRIQVLEWYHKNGRNQSATAVHFASVYPKLNIKQPLISSWVKDEPKWRKRMEKGGEQNERAAKRARQTVHPQVSQMMNLWISNAMSDGILLTGNVLRHKWGHFADLVGVPSEDRLKLSNGWLESLKIRCGLKQITRHGEAASSDPTTVEDERNRIQDLIRDALEDGYNLCDIFNADETGLFWGYVICICDDLTSYLI